MNFKEYDNFISNHKFDMLEFIIYYNLTCNDGFKNLKENNIITLIEFIHRAYLKDESKLDLGCICDKAMEYSNYIINDKDGSFTVWDLLENCLEG